MTGIEYNPEVDGFKGDYNFPVVRKVYFPFWEHKPYSVHGGNSPHMGRKYKITVKVEEGKTAKRCFRSIDTINENITQVFKRKAKARLI